MKKGSKILCPIDFSEGSDYAMLCANKLADRLEAEVHCVHVINPAPYSHMMEGVYVSSASVEATVASIEEHTREEFEKRLIKYQLMHIKAKGHFLHGKPAQEVVALADLCQAGPLAVRNFRSFARRRRADRVGSRHASRTQRAFPCGVAKVRCTADTH